MLPGGPGLGCQAQSWLTHGSFREQQVVGASRAPDLTVALIGSEVFEGEDCQRSLRLTARVGSGSDDYRLVTLSTSSVDKVVDEFSTTNATAGHSRSFYEPVTFCPDQG